MSRLHDIQEFYGLLDNLEEKIQGAQMFSELGREKIFPMRGVYFIFGTGEIRSNSGIGPRIVRVGTHALTTGSRSTLRQRLSAHRGRDRVPGGNHRGSIFRLLVGDALFRKTPGFEIDTWGVGSSAPRATRERENPLEAQVSEQIGAMSFLWLKIDDAPGPESKRGYIERNSIAMLSNWKKPVFDPPSKNWLGGYSSRERVQHSGLWNNRHVDEGYDADFLKILLCLIERL